MQGTGPQAVEIPGIQKLWGSPDININRKSPPPMGWKGGVGNSRWKLPVGAGGPGSALHSGREGGKYPGFSLPSHSHPLPSVGWTPMTEDLECSEPTTPALLRCWAGKGQEGPEGNQPRLSIARKSHLSGLSIRLLWRKCFCPLRSLSVSYSISFIPCRDLVR